VVASITVGVFAIGVIVSAYAIIARDINLSFASVHPANIEIWTDPFYEDLVRVVERTPGVTAAEGRRILGIRAREAGSGLWQDLNLIAAPGLETLAINQLSPLEGASTPDIRETVISQSFMNTTGFHVGRNIEIELPDGSLHELRLVGLVNDQATGEGGPTGEANAYVTTQTQQWLGLGQSFNRLYVTVTDAEDRSAIQHIADTVKDRVERHQPNVYRMETRVSNEHPMATTILAMMGVLGALGVLIMVLSAALITNTLNALLAQQRRQIGIMKLIGGRSPQILGMYLILICVYGVMALVMAVPAGAFAGYGFAEFIASLMGTGLLGFRIVPAAIVLQVFVAFLIPLGAGFLPVRKGARTSVRRAIANDRPGEQASDLSWLNRLSDWARWISRPILFSIRNTFRQRSRLALTLFTLTIAGAVFIGVFNVRASMGNFLAQLTRHFMGDVTVVFSRPYAIGRIEQVVLPMPGVVSLEGWGGASAEIVDQDDEVVENLQIIAPPADTKLLSPDIVAGRWLKPGEGHAVVISDTIYEALPELRPGDTIRVKFPGHREEAWAVVGVFRFVSMSGDPIAYADFDFIADLLDLPNQAFSYRVTTTDHTLDGQRAFSQSLDQSLSDRGFMVRSVQAGKTIQEDASKGIDILIVFLLIMALLTAFVGSIGLTGTMGMNVLERTREIGVLRAIGAVDMEIIKSVVIEGVMIGLITWVLALVASFPVSYFLLRIIGKAMMGSSLELATAPQGMAIWLLAVVLLAVVASLLPARNAARLTIREVLAYE
jgi:putative ABC transport system permease protein